MVVNKVVEVPREKDNPSQTQQDHLFTFPVALCNIPPNQATVSKAAGMCNLNK